MLRRMLEKLKNKCIRELFSSLKITLKNCKTQSTCHTKHERKKSLPDHVDVGNDEDDEVEHKPQTRQYFKTLPVVVHSVCAMHIRRRAKFLSISQVSIVRFLHQILFNIAFMRVIEVQSAAVQVHTVISRSSHESRYTAAENELNLN